MVVMAVVGGGAVSDQWRRSGMIMLIHHEWPMLFFQIGVLVKQNDAIVRLSLSLFLP